MNQQISQQISQQINTNNRRKFKHKTVWKKHYYRQFDGFNTEAENCSKCVTSPFKARIRDSSTSSHDPLPYKCLHHRHHSLARSFLFLSVFHSFLFWFLSSFCSFFLFLSLSFSLFLPSTTWYLTLETNANLWNHADVSTFDAQQPYLSVWWLCWNYPLRRWKWKWSLNHYQLSIQVFSRIARENHTKQQLPSRQKVIWFLEKNNLHQITIDGNNH